MQRSRVTYNALTIITYACASVVTYTLSKPRSNFIQDDQISDIYSSVLQRALNGKPSVCVQISKEFFLTIYVWEITVELRLSGRSLSGSAWTFV
jgi:hypothetical protein